MNSYLKKAIENKEKKKIRPSFDLPMEEFIPACENQSPQWYGTAIINKIFNDLVKKMVKVSAKESSGDGYILCRRTEYDPLIDEFIPMEYSIYFEGKVSFSNITNGSTHRITHIRPWHNVQVYLVVLVDQEDYFRTRFYILPKEFIFSKAGGGMNNTAEENKHNMFVDGAFTIDKNQAYKEFGEKNYLKGTSYGDLIDYVNYLYSSSNTSTQKKPLPEKSNSIVSAMSNSITNINRRIPHRSPVKFALEVNGVRIQGKSNYETIIKFANYISPYEALMFFPMAWLSSQKDKYKNIKIERGNYYLNPKLSIRDLKSIFNKGKERSKLNVRLIEL